MRRIEVLFCLAGSALSSYVALNTQDAGATAARLEFRGEILEGTCRMEAAAVDPLEVVAAQAPLPLWRGVTAAARGTEATADAGEAREVEIVLDDCPRGAKARRETVAPPPVDMLPMDYIVTDQ